MFVQRTLAEHGDVPVRRSVQACATRGNPHVVLRAALTQTSELWRSHPVLRYSFRY